MARRRYKAKPLKPLAPSEEQIDKACTSKVTYYSRAFAESTALMVRASQQIKVYPYECRYCNNWHLSRNY